MKRYVMLAAVVWILPVSLVLAQPAPAGKPEPAKQDAPDKIAEESSKLELELGKYKDSSPEAGATLVKLIEIYHKHGRLFGLVRAGQKFVATQASDPRHPAMMLKLIDGLEALSRNQDMVGACRQFLERYPKAPECPAIEVRLAETLARIGDRPRAAQACKAVWERQPGTETGRQFGVRAIAALEALASSQWLLEAAAVAEDMVDKLPAGPLAADVGWRGFSIMQRLNQPAKANILGNKLLKKGASLDKTVLRDLHIQMSQNYALQQQAANALESIRQARAIQDGQDVHSLLITRMYAAEGTGAQLEPVANEYLAKYAQREDRFSVLAPVAQAYARDKNPAKAMALYKQLMLNDAVVGDSARQFVSLNGKEPAQIAESERVLREAIQKNPKSADYLTYILATDVYDSKMKDRAKARQLMRDRLFSAKSDVSYANEMARWLLMTATNEQEFRADVDRMAQLRRENLDRPGCRDWLVAYLESIRQHPTKRDEARYIRDHLKRIADDPVLGLWLQQRSMGGPESDEMVRARLIDPAVFNKLSETMKRGLLWQQAEYLRNYAPSGKLRVELLDKLIGLSPKDYKAAAAFVTAAADYGTPEAAKKALQHLLKFEPESAAGDLWSRMMASAEKNKDAALAKQVLVWIKKAETKFGKNASDAARTGDSLVNLAMEKEAVEFWNSYLTFDRNNSTSRECASRLRMRLEAAARLAFDQELLKHDTPYIATYAGWLADDYLVAGDLNKFEQTLRDARKARDERPFRIAGFNHETVWSWVDIHRTKTDLPEATRKRVLTTARDLNMGRASMAAHLALLDLAPPESIPPMQRLLAYQQATRMSVGDHQDWDTAMAVVQSLMNRREYLAASTLLTGMLANMPSADATRKDSGRTMVAQCYTRIGAVGMTIDETSQAAPLQRAALYLRLGDERLAFEGYTAHRRLFDKLRDQVPPDLLIFICQRLIAAGGEENLNDVETYLREWLIKNADSQQFDDGIKAQVQLLLAKGFFRAQRFDVARAEFTTVVNRFANTPYSIEAQFGIGETYMAQKVYDQAQAVFEKLAMSRDADVIVRAEFLRGVLAFQRGDTDEARDIFRGVLDRVPSVELADQALYRLAEVYGLEQRYLDQLLLLRTVGRLGRASKRNHVPGQALAIVVYDSDLGISRGHNRIPVVVTTSPGGDRETVYLTSAGAGKGLFRTDVDTRLGEAVPDNKVLEVTGKDVIKCDYPNEFKAEFRHVPLSDVEIHIAADATLQAASAKIVDQKKETFSDLLIREIKEKEEEIPAAEVRPANQVKPGNLVYLQVIDGDRDLTSQPDDVIVKLTAESGDQVQVTMKETGPHTGIFEATVQTGELPAGALATDAAIDHGPLLAIDQDPKTYWQSKPDGVTPKALTVDLRDLHRVARAKFSTPDAARYAPVGGELQGSIDGEFWFRLTGHPDVPAAAPVTGECGQMRYRIYDLDWTKVSDWKEVADLTARRKPVEEGETNELAWKRKANVEDPKEARRPFAAVFHGKLVQPREGAVRIAVTGTLTAIAVDGALELPLGPTRRHVDLWLTSGTHDLTIFAAAADGSQGVEATCAHADLSSAKVVLRPFRELDFDLDQPAAQKKTEPPKAAAQPITLKADAARLQKDKEGQIALQKQAGDPQIGQWSKKEDWVDWEFEVAAPGVYNIDLQCSHAGTGGKFQVEVAGQKVTGDVRDTGTAKKFIDLRVAAVFIDKAGKHTLAVKPVQIEGGTLMDLRGAVLTPVEGASVVRTGTDWEFRIKPMELRYLRLVIRDYLGEAVAINHVEVQGEKPDQVYIPTKADILSLAANQILEIAGGDVVTATYTDELVPADTGRSRVLNATLTATYYNADIVPITYGFVRNPNGEVTAVPRRALRVEPGERFVVQVRDYDEDRTNDLDKIKIQVGVNDGKMIEVTAVETLPNSGIFTKEIDTVGPKGEKAPAQPAPASQDGSTQPAASGENVTLTIKPGDQIVCRYADKQNTFPGHSVPRDTVVLANQPTDGRMRIMETVIIPPPVGSTAAPKIVYRPAERGKKISHVSLAAPMQIEVVDPDAAKDADSSVTVTLVTTDGAKLDVKCVVPLQRSYLIAAPLGEDPLAEGKFVGQVFLQLGGKESPDTIPVTVDMPKLIGGPVMEEAKEEEGARKDTAIITRALNLSGKDVVTATYRDARRPAGKPEDLTATSRLIVDGTLMVTDSTYEKPVDRLYSGEKVFLKVTDADRDVSNERDAVEVEITSANGEKELVKLEETLAHSGVFTGSLQVKAVEKPTPGNLNPQEPVIEGFFGDTLRFRHVDKTATSQTGELELVCEVPIVVGTNALVAAFTKTFSNEQLAVETKFHIAEGHFELFKNHRALGRLDEARADLEAGRRILREVMEDYTDSKYVPRVAYLLAQFAQELGQWDEAVRSYQVILRQYSDHVLAPDAQYKLAQCYEEAGDFDQALEAYVTLAATFPKSPLIANVMIRISDYFYKKENFVVAAQVGEKFLEKFAGHQHGPRMAFRVGQCYYKAKAYERAGKAFDQFAKIFSEDKLAAESLFWAGESYRMGNNNRLAFQRYNRCRWDFPASEAAKYARGRLALPEMLAQFEADSASLNSPDQ